MIYIYIHIIYIYISIYQYIKTTTTFACIMGVSGAYGGFRCGSVRSAQRGWCWDCVRGIASSQFAGMGYSWISHFFCKYQQFLTIFRATITLPWGAVLFFFRIPRIFEYDSDGWSLLGYIGTTHELIIFRSHRQFFWVHIFLGTTFHPWNLCLYNLVSNFGCHDIQRSTSSNVLITES